MSIGSMKQLRTAMLNYKKDIPKIMRRHEVLSVLFVFIYLIIFFTRWCIWLNMGWADYSKYIYGGNEFVPGCMDATTAAIFVITLFTFPRGYSFWHVLCEHKKSKLPPLKMESTILWWRFVDKNLNYAYMFLIGSGVAIARASRTTGLEDVIAEHFQNIHFHSFYSILFLICLFAVMLANIMPGVAGVVVFLPFVIAICLGTSAAIENNPDIPINYYRLFYYLCSLAVGIGCSFGFMSPFLYTPAYFCHYTGKVPKKKMAKYGLFAAIICCVLLWLSLVFWAPRIWYMTIVTQVPSPSQAVAPVAAATPPPAPEP